ncbi:hypothetical protein SCB29_34540 [Paraburkholderia sp. SIMBA_055]|uniref:hypothetical protein n=1 Tax=Paraburkholderia sp. SIMBA_054 TaxID=3085795 RepID=UPI00397C159A
MNSDKSAPLACSLSAKDFKDRANWLKELASNALLAHHVEGLCACLTYRAEAAEDVERLVSQEQQCCGFLRFQVTRNDEHVELTITAPESAGEDARALFAHLIPGEPA